jgi:axial budding pattern protein 2
LVVKQDAAQQSVEDDLSMGLHYVQTLGTDEPVNTAPSTLTVSTNVRSSFSTEDSWNDGDVGDHNNTVRMVVRTGEQFNFRVTLQATSATVSAQAKRQLDARLISGRPLPPFLHADLISRKHRGSVEFYGLPSPRDIGDFDVGVYTEDNTRIARVFLEIVAR